MFTRNRRSTIPERDFAVLRDTHPTLESGRPTLGLTLPNGTIIGRTKMMREQAAAAITIRLAREEDTPALVEMVNDFVRGHPAENHARPEGAVRAAYFGENPVAEVIVAEWHGRVVAMVQWTRIFDMFWSMFGGLAEWLYVKPRARGLGLSAAMLAMVSRRVREAGGEFVHGSGGEHLASLYRRLASESGTSRGYYLSGEGFQQAADLAGRPPREVVRHFPSPTLSSVPARPRRERQ